MAKFTIKDLAEGKCAVKNDGTVEELNKVLKEAFQTDKKIFGDCSFYFLNEATTCWTGWFTTQLPTQSVKDFLEELETPKLPKRGDKILVSDKGNNWREAIFVTYIKGILLPIMCVYFDDEYDFKNNKIFRVVGWKYWKSIPEKKVLEVTLEDVAKQFKVDEVKIIEKKG